MARETANGGWTEVDQGDQLSSPQRWFFSQFDPDFAINLSRALALADTITNFRRIVKLRK
jgi:hypothetical protein